MSKSGNDNNQNNTVSGQPSENIGWEDTFDALPHFVCILDMDGKIVRANKAMMSRFSAEHGDLSGKDYRLVLCGTTDPEQQYTNATVVGDAPSFWMETEVPSRDGWYRIATSPLFDEDESQIGAVCTISDITQRKNTEVELIRFRAALDSSMDNIYLIDRATMRFVDANRSGWLNLGYTKDELIEIGPHDIMVEYDLDRFAKLFDTIIYSDSHSSNIEATCLCKDGTEFPVDISLRTLEVNGSKMIVAAARDISERKRQEKELIEAKEAAEQASTAKSQFLSQMSHELRTPLNAILGFSQYLLMDDDINLSFEQKDSVNEIMKAGEHLLNLITDILDLATLDAGRIHLSMRPVKIAGVFQDCEKLIRPSADERKVSIDMGNSVQSEIVINTDPTRFKQILLNLMSNAVKYNVTNGHIKVDLEEKQGCVRINVTDTGIGVPIENRDSLFEPFNRVNPAVSHITGTGIGLVISKSLAQLMGGDIGYKPVPGGSCFWFELPSSPAIEQPELEQLHDISQYPATPEGDTVHSILYVEDDPVNLKLVERLLAGKDRIKLLTTSDPNVGLQLAKSQKLDIVLLDLNLPEMSGYDLFGYMRELPHLTDIPILAISADAMPHDIEKCLELGFSDYITKPIDVIAFLQKIDELLVKNKSSIS